MEPEENFDAFWDGMGKDVDQRYIDEIEDIDLREENFKDYILDNFTSFELVIPDTSDNAAFLCEQLTTLIFTLDDFYQNVQNGDIFPSHQTASQLSIIRNNLMNQFCIADLSLENVYKFTVDRKDYEQHLDLCCFYCILECVACMSLHPENVEKLMTMKPKDYLKFLCQKTVISRELANTPVWEFSPYQILQAFKYLEAQWNFVEYHVELLLYMDLLMYRISHFYKVPQSVVEYTGVLPWCRVTQDGAFCSNIMLQDLCWTLRPMYQKVRTRMKISQQSEIGKIPDAVSDQLNKIAAQNARDMNNTDLSEKYRNMYLRYAVRPSEVQRFLRDKPGKYASPIHVMKHGRTKEAVDRMLEQLANAPWLIVHPSKPILDKTSTDIMKMLVINALVSNIWGFQWKSRFVVLNLDIVSVEDITTRLNSSLPVVVQDFNRFNLYYKERLFLHNNVAKCFAHWYTIMCQRPFNGKYEGKNLKTTMLTFLLNNDYYKQ